MKIQLTRAFVAIAALGVVTAASAAPRVHHTVAVQQTQVQTREDGAPFLQPHMTAAEKMMFDRTSEPVD